MILSTGTSQFPKKIFPIVDNENRLYLAVALTKIEPGVMGDTISDKNRTSTRLLPVSVISIPQFIKKSTPETKNFTSIYRTNSWMQNKRKQSARRLPMMRQNTGENTRYMKLVILISNTPSKPATPNARTRHRLKNSPAKSVGLRSLTNPIHKQTPINLHNAS